MGALKIWDAATAAWVYVTHPRSHDHSLAADGSAINLVGAATTTDVLTAKVTGDSVPRLIANADGKLEWASGAGAADTALARLAAASAGITGLLTVSKMPGVYGINGAKSTVTQAGGPLNMDLGTVTDPYGGVDGTNIFWTVPSGMGGLYLIGYAPEYTNPSAASIFIRMQWSKNAAGQSPLLTHWVDATGGTSQSLSGNGSVVTVLSAGDAIRFLATVVNAGASCDMGIGAWYVIRLHTNALG